MRARRWSRQRDALRKKKLAFDHYTCQACGLVDRTGKDLRLDEIVPITLGGAETWENTQTLCWRCNGVKGMSRMSNAEVCAVREASNEAPRRQRSGPASIFGPRRPLRRASEARSLIVLMGAPGSGKSTYAERFDNVITMDELRAFKTLDRRGVNGLYTEAYDAIASYLASDQTVVFDSTAASPVTRRRLREVASAAKASAKLVVFATPLDICLARQDQRRDAVPPERVRELHQSIADQRPQLQREGWASVEVVA